MSSIFKLAITSVLMTIISKSVVADTTIEVLYSESNSDYSSFANESGTALSAAFDISDNLFLAGYYNNTEFRPGGRHGQSVVESWADIGIGYSFDTKLGDFYTLLTFNEVDISDDNITGSSLNIGYKTNMGSNWAAEVRFGYLDLDNHDWQLMGKLYYKISENFALTIGLRDYHNWDYTNYEGGVVFRF